MVHSVPDIKVLASLKYATTLPCKCINFYNITYEMHVPDASHPHLITFIPLTMGYGMLRRDAKLRAPPTEPRFCSPKFSCKNFNVHFMIFVIFSQLFFYSAFRRCHFEHFCNSLGSILLMAFFTFPRMIEMMKFTILEKGWERLPLTTQRWARARFRYLIFCLEFRTSGCVLPACLRKKSWKSEMNEQDALHFKIKKHLARQIFGLPLLMLCMLAGVSVCVCVRVCGSWKKTTFQLETNAMKMYGLPNGNNLILHLPRCKWNYTPTQTEWH